MAVLEFVEHPLHRLIIVGQRFADASRQALVINKLAQTLAGERQVARIGVVSPRRFFLPGPFWQRAEHPLQHAH